jgi:type I restriction enzyme, S subunit
MSSTLPSGWEWIGLGRICELPDRQVKPPEFRQYGNYVGLEDIESGTGRVVQYKNVRDLELKSSKFPFDPSCILYGKLRPYLNKVAIPNVGGICSTDILPLKPNTDIVSKEYLYFYLRSPYFVKTASERSTGANLPRITPNSLVKIPVPLPPIEMQRKIAQILLRVDQLIQLRREAYHVTSMIIQSIFMKMFGDPSVNPVGWERRPLGSAMASKLLHGKSLVRAKVNSDGQGIAVLKLGALTDFELDPKEHKYYNDGSVEERYFLKMNDILISRSNTLGLVGRSGRYVGQPNRCLFPDLMIRVRPNQAILDPVYLESYLKTDFVRNFFRQRARGTSGNMPKISNKDIEELRVLIPPGDLQQKFASVVRQILSTKDNQEESKEELGELLHSLMAKAFRGGLRFD